MAKPSVQQLILEKVTSVESDVKELHKKIDDHVVEISNVKERLAKNEGFVRILVGIFTAAIAGIISMFFGFFHK